MDLMDKSYFDIAAVKEIGSTASISISRHHKFPYLWIGVFHSACYLSVFGFNVNFSPPSPLALTASFIIPSVWIPPVIHNSIIST
jgi:hypothetical protein